jgi:hypothetical protein
MNFEAQDLENHATFDAFSELMPLFTAFAAKPQLASSQQSVCIQAIDEANHCLHLLLTLNRFSQ